MGNGSAGGSPGLNSLSTSRPQTLPYETRPDEVLDVHAAVAQRAALPVRLGDLGLECDDTLEAGDEVGHRDSLGGDRRTRRRTRWASVFNPPRTRARRRGPASGPSSWWDRGVNEDSRMADLRVPYDSGPLLEEDLAADPLAMFRRWFAEAQSAGIPEPNAMTVATSTLDGDVSARTVLLKDVGPRGFAFYTNRRSRKGLDLAENPRAALVVPWLLLHRQVVVTGEVAPVTRGEVEAYFATRPYGSRLSAWASRQSTVIQSRAVLEDRVAAVSRDYPEGGPVPVPDDWGGSWSGPSRSSSGRAAPPGCTTGSATGRCRRTGSRPWTRRPRGWWSGSPLEGQAAGGSARTRRPAGPRRGPRTPPPGHRSEAPPTGAW